MANDQFIRDVNRFCEKVEDRIQYVAFGIAKELHSRLVDVTPYRTGRARASWNISADFSDEQPAPDIKIGTDLGASQEDIAMANVFYDSVIASKSRYTLVNGAFDYYVVNTVHYIEQLNGGSSSQAPRAFFETTIASAPTIAARVVKGIII